MQELESTNIVVSSMVDENLNGEHEASISNGMLELLSHGNPKPNRAKLGRLRKKYLTVNYPKIKDCGHKYDPNRQPKYRNCESCWFQYFQSHGEAVKVTDEMFRAEGPGIIIQLGGKTFLENFLKFMSTLANIKKAQENG